MKLRDFSELVIEFTVEDEADFLIWFEEVADHAGVVEDLLCALSNLLWEGAEKVKWFDFDKGHLTLFGALEVRPPRPEDVFLVWEQDAADIILGVLDSFEKLENDLGIGWDAFCCLAPEDKEDILAWFDQLLCLFAAGATQLHRWENGLVKGISTAVENTNDEASGNLS